MLLKILQVVTSFLVRLTIFAVISVVSFVFDDSVDWVLFLVVENKLDKTE